MSILFLRPWPSVPMHPPKASKPGDETTWPTRAADVAMAGAGYVPPQAELGMRRTRQRAVLTGAPTMMIVDVPAHETVGSDGRMLHVGARQIPRRPAVRLDPGYAATRSLAVLSACGVGFALVVLMVMIIAAHAPVGLP